MLRRQESPMTRTRTWTVCRQPVPSRDAERRWDQAYQLLVRWGCRGGGADCRSWRRRAAPPAQWVLKTRGAVAEYEGTLIPERRRRGGQAGLRGGTLRPWPRPPFGYRLDPDRPRDAAAVRTEPGEA